MAYQHLIFRAETSRRGGHFWSVSSLKSGQTDVEACAGGCFLHILRSLGCALYRARLCPIWNRWEQTEQQFKIQTAEDDIQDKTSGA